MTVEERLKAAQENLRIAQKLIGGIEDEWMRGRTELRLSQAIDSLVVIRHSPDLTAWLDSDERT